MKNGLLANCWAVLRGTAVQVPQSEGAAGAADVSLGALLAPSSSRRSNSGKARMIELGIVKVIIPRIPATEDRNGRHPGWQAPVVFPVSGTTLTDGCANNENVLASLTGV